MNPPREIAKLGAMFLESPELYDAIYHFKNYAHECEILRAVIAVAAPVCEELNTGSLTPTTVIVSAMVATFSVNSRSCATPRLSVMPI